MDGLKSFVVKVLVILIGMFAISCNNCLMANSDQDQDINKLIDCLALTSDVNSMEVDLTSNNKVDGQPNDLKINMHMKVEDIKGDLKAIVSVDQPGLYQEFILNIENEKAYLYTKDTSGEYLVQSVALSQLGEIELTKSFKAYIEIINTNPDIVKKVSENIYQLNVPKENAAEYYSKISGKTLGFSFETLVIEFIIGNDGYLQNVNLKADVDSVSLDMKAKYFNYNQEFNIVLPDVYN
ncbi:MAG: hypothetical protein GXY86_17785 [Firmicutes bacterium]|nr:hypothetical protein [Bacillota bacterium]